MSLARKVGGRIERYHSVPFLAVKRGLMEIDHGVIPDHVRRYHLTLPKEIEHKKVYLLDTENCGLRYSDPIIMVTLGSMNGEFILRNFTAQDYYGEKAVLARTLKLLREADRVFTYNGEAFDLPRLSRRIGYHGLFRKSDKPDLVDMLGDRHCDIYPIMREVAKGNDVALLDRQLQTLEKMFFKVFREDEVRGADIPGVYEDFIRGGIDYAQQEEFEYGLARVIEHNMLDVASTSAVLEFLQRQKENVWGNLLENRAIIRYTPEHVSDVKVEASKVPDADGSKPDKKPARRRKIIHPF